MAGEQSSYRIEKRYIRKDGTSVWAEVRVSLVREAASAKPLYSVAVVNDISLQRRAEEALTRRSAELQALLDHLPDIVARFDRQGRHLYVNPAVERATGLSAGQFIGLTNRDLGMPAGLVDQWDALAEVLESGESREMDSAFPSPDGERRFWSLLVPEHDADGSIVGALSVARDITDTAALPRPVCAPEVSSVEQGDAFHTLFELAGMGMADVALDGRWLRVNERLCEMMGHSSRELEGRPFQEVTVAEDHAIVLGQIRRLAAGEATGCALRQRFVRRDGETVHADVTMALVADAQGRPRHLLAVLHDRLAAIGWAGAPLGAAHSGAASVVYGQGPLRSWTAARPPSSVRITCSAWGWMSRMSSASGCMRCGSRELRWPGARRNPRRSHASVRDP